MITRSTAEIRDIWNIGLLENAECALVSKLKGGGRDRGARNDEHAERQWSSHLRAERNNGDKPGTSVTSKQRSDWAAGHDQATAKHRTIPKNDEKHGHIETYIDLTGCSRKASLDTVWKRVALSKSLCR